jgi:hypothetical protein
VASHAANESAVQRFQFSRPFLPLLYPPAGRWRETDLATVDWSSRRNKEKNGTAIMRAGLFDGVGFSEMEQAAAPNRTAAGTLPLPRPGSTTTARMLRRRCATPFSSPLLRFPLLICCATVPCCHLLRFRPDLLAPLRFPRFPAVGGAYWSILPTRIPRACRWLLLPFT